MKSGELLGFTIASIHNLGFYLWLVSESRKHIIVGDFNEWKIIQSEKFKTRL